MCYLKCSNYWSKGFRCSKCHGLMGWECLSAIRWVIACPPSCLKEIYLLIWWCTCCEYQLLRHKLWTVTRCKMLVHAHISFCTSKICVWPTLRPWVMRYQLWMICTSNLCIVFGASSALLLSLPFCPKPGTACCGFFSRQKPKAAPHALRDPNED